jgi:hypothetical protein
VQLCHTKGVAARSLPMPTQSNLTHTTHDHILSTLALPRLALPRKSQAEHTALLLEQPQLLRLIRVLRTANKWISSATNSTVELNSTSTQQPSTRQCQQLYPLKQQAQERECRPNAGTMAPAQVLPATNHAQPLLLLLPLLLQAAATKRMLQHE